MSGEADTVMVKVGDYVQQYDRLLYIVTVHHGECCQFHFHNYEATGVILLNGNGPIACDVNGGCPPAPGYWGVNNKDTPNQDYWPYTILSKQEAELILLKARLDGVPCGHIPASSYTHSTPTG